ncbi:hypothetical protein ACG3QZ_14810 [Pseudomonas aeruginosa]|uniref:hypothetical protein n=1 Tax=Pseudomonas aeruginosa TaxID=287 RepID=UPI0037499EB9
MILGDSLPGGGPGHRRALPPGRFELLLARPLDELAAPAAPNGERDRLAEEVGAGGLARMGGEYRAAQLRRGAGGRVTANWRNRSWPFIAPASRSSKLEAAAENAEDIRLHDELIERLRRESA